MLFFHFQICFKMFINTFMYEVQLHTCDIPIGESQPCLLCEACTSAALGLPVTLSFPPHRSVKASHILISTDGKVCLSGLRSNLSMISHGRRQRAVHDFPKYSIKVLPWLSPEVLQQVCDLGCKEPLDFPGKPRNVLGWGHSGVW